MPVLHKTTSRGRTCFLARADGTPSRRRTGAPLKVEGSGGGSGRVDIVGAGRRLQGLLRWEVCPSSCSTLSPIAIEDPPGPLAEANGEPRGGGTVGWWRDGAGTAGRRGVLGRCYGGGAVGRRRGMVGDCEGGGVAGRLGIRECCGQPLNRRTRRSDGCRSLSADLAMGIGEGADDGWIALFADYRSQRRNINRMAAVRERQTDERGGARQTDGRVAHSDFLVEINQHHSPSSKIDQEVT